MPATRRSRNQGAIFGWALDRRDEVSGCVSGARDPIKMYAAVIHLLWSAVVCRGWWSPKSVLSAALVRSNFLSFCLIAEVIDDWFGFRDSTCSNYPLAIHIRCHFAMYNERNKYDNPMHIMKDCLMNLQHAVIKNNTCACLTSIHQLFFHSFQVWDSPTLCARACVNALIEEFRLPRFIGL